MLDGNRREEAVGHQEVRFKSGVAFLNHRAPQVVGDELTDGLVAPTLGHLSDLITTALRPDVAVEHPLDGAENGLDFHPEALHLVVALPMIIEEVNRIATDFVIAVFTLDIPVFLDRDDRTALAQASEHRAPA